MTNQGSSLDQGKNAQSYALGNRYCIHVMYLAALSPPFCKLKVTLLLHYEATTSVSP
jgi:hypothetical protein